MNKFESRFFINGQFTECLSGQTFELHNPANGELLANIPRALEDDVNAAVIAAKAAQPAWEARPSMERAEIIRKFANMLKDDGHQERIAEMEAVSMGRNKKSYKDTIFVAAEMINYISGLAQNVHGDSSLNTTGFLNVTLKQPYGVVAAIIPWNVPVFELGSNYALAMWAMKVPAAIGAGNAIILKTSEKAPLTALYLAKLSHDAGVPPGIINVISGEGATGELLSSHMEIRKISFTGSGRAGRLVAKAAANSNLKQVSLELGGKSPAIVFDDVDINAAVRGLSFSITRNSGQSCMASSRVYVHESIAKVFQEKFKSYMSSIKHGDPLTAEKDKLGPQADDIQGKSVLNYISIGQKDGKVLTGGNRVGTQGYNIEPTIFTDVPDDSRINKEEIFGPVVIIHTFKDETEVVHRANNTDYGLYASVYTNDFNRAIRVSRALESGTVAVNSTSPMLAADMPFGGYKASGYGREMGPNAVNEWLETKTVLMNYSPL